MDWPTIVVSALVSAGFSLAITFVFWFWQTHWTRPKFEISGIERPTDGHYSIHICNRRRRYVYDVTVAAQLVIPRDDNTDEVVGIPIEAGATSNVNHIPALGPAGGQNSPDADNRFVFLYFEGLHHSSLLPEPYRHEDWIGQPELASARVVHLLKNELLTISGRKPTIWISVDGMDEHTHARQYRKVPFIGDDFP
jgi:hypothetical protein